MSIIQEVITPDYSDSNYPGGLYKITNANQLYWLFLNNLNLLTSSSNNAGSTTNKICFKLMENINMQNQEFNSVVSELNNMIFDGNNKNISNLNYNGNLFSIINEQSSFINTNFENVNGKTCLIGDNYGIIRNCKFNNINITNNCVLANYNSNLITDCRFNNIKINKINNNNNITLSVISNRNSFMINNCKINNITFNGLSNCAVVSGTIAGLQRGQISNLTINNIKFPESNEYKYSAICNDLSNNNCIIEKCSININLNNNTSLIAGTINASNVTIKCITFKTRKGNNNDNKIDLKYNRQLENKKREDKKKRITTTSIITTPTTTTRIVISDKLFFNTVSSYDNISIINIYKSNSENKMSKLDYPYIKYDDTLSCTMEMPPISLKKDIKEEDVENIKKKLKDIIKQKYLLDVDITSKVEDSTLYITISDSGSSTSTSTSTSSSSSSSSSGAEHFGTVILEVIYIYNTSDNIAIMDALNDQSIEPSDLLVPSNNMILYLIGILLLFIIFFILKMNNKL